MNVIGVDVGTTSVRLAIISFLGDQFQEASVVASCKRDINLTQDGVRFEQNSMEIWDAICSCSRECLKKSEAVISREPIASIAFSATCSLVIVGDDVGQSTSKSGNDVIMWMDHRAIEEADNITKSQSKVLDQFGGTCSPEFTLSKLIWLKQNDPQRFNSAKSFFELPDWLVYKCIGGDPSSCPRSLCSVTCKWGFDADLYKHCDQINNIASSDSIQRFGQTILGPGCPASWLSTEAAIELGLLDPSNKENLQHIPRISVGTSLIDAHSGMLAMLSAPLDSYGITNRRIESTFCSLAGTSSCHMLLSKEKNFTKGIWGPYKDVVLQGYSLLEAGQSLTGKLIEITIESHEEGKRRLQSGERMYDIIESLNMKATEMDGKFKQHLHILPTFHGNRSPLANPRLRGGIYGLSAEGTRGLLEYYIATLESIIYEFKLIIETLGTSQKLDTILVSGGLMKNKLFMQLMADILSCQVIKMSLDDVDFMVMGSGLVARHAALQSCCISSSSSLPVKTLDLEPLTEFSIQGIKYNQLDIEIYKPRQANNNSDYFEKRFKCYKEFVELSLKIDNILNTD